eukprot:gene4416-6243_t
MKVLTITLLEKHVGNLYQQAEVVFLNALDISSINKNDTKRLLLKAAVIVNFSKNKINSESISSIWNSFPNVWWLDLSNNSIDSLKQTFPLALGWLSLSNNLTLRDFNSISKSHILRLTLSAKLEALNEHHNPYQSFSFNISKFLPNVWVINDDYITQSDRIKFKRFAASDSQKDILKETPNEFHDINVENSPAKLSSNHLSLSDQIRDDINNIDNHWSTRQPNSRESILIYAIQQALPKNDILVDSFKLEILLEDYLEQADIHNKFVAQVQVSNNIAAKNLKFLPTINIDSLLFLPHKLRLDLSVLLTTSILFTIPDVLMKDTLMILLHKHISIADISSIFQLPSFARTAIIYLLRRISKQELDEIKTLTFIPLKEDILPTKTVNSSSNNNSSYSNNYLNGSEGFKYLKLIKKYFELTPNDYSAKCNIDNENIRKFDNFSEIELEILSILPDYPTYFSNADHIIRRFLNNSNNNANFVYNDWITFGARHAVILLTKSPSCPPLTKSQTNMQSQNLYFELLPLLKAASMTLNDLDIHLIGADRDGRILSDGIKATGVINKRYQSNRSSSTAINNNTQSTLANPINQNQMDQLLMKSEIDNNATKLTTAFQSIGGKVLPFGSGLLDASTSSLAWNNASTSNKERLSVVLATTKRFSSINRDNNNTEINGIHYDIASLVTSNTPNNLTIPLPSNINTNNDSMSAVSGMESPAETPKVQSPKLSPMRFSNEINLRRLNSSTSLRSLVNEVQDAYDKKFASNENEDDFNSKSSAVDLANGQMITLSVLLPAPLVASRSSSFSAQLSRPTSPNIINQGNDNALRKSIILPLGLNEKDKIIDNNIKESMILINQNDVISPLGSSRSGSHIGYPNITQPINTISYFQSTNQNEDNKRLPSRNNKSNITTKPIVSLFSADANYNNNFILAPSRIVSDFNQNDNPFNKWDPIQEAPVILNAFNRRININEALSFDDSIAMNEDSPNQSSHKLMTETESYKQPTLSTITNIDNIQRKTTPLPVLPTKSTEIKGNNSKLKLPTKDLSKSFTSKIELEKQQIDLLVEMGTIRNVKKFEKMKLMDKLKANPSYHERVMTNNTSDKSKMINYYDNDLDKSYFDGSESDSLSNNLNIIKPVIIKPEAPSKNEIKEQTPVEFFLTEVDSKPVVQPSDLPEDDLGFTHQITPLGLTAEEARVMLLNNTISTVELMKLKTNYDKIYTNSNHIEYGDISVGGARLSQSWYPCYNKKVYTIATEPISASCRTSFPYTSKYLPTRQPKISVLRNKDKWTVQHNHVTLAPQIFDNSTLSVVDSNVSETLSDSGTISEHSLSKSINIDYENNYDNNNADNNKQDNSLMKESYEFNQSMEATLKKFENNKSSKKKKLLLSKLSGYPPRSANTLEPILRISSPLGPRPRPMVVTSSSMKLLNPVKKGDRISLPLDNNNIISNNTKQSSHSPQSRSSIHSKHTTSQFSGTYMLEPLNGSDELDYARSATFSHELLVRNIRNNLNNSTEYGISPPPTSHFLDAISRSKLNNSISFIQSIQKEAKLVVKVDNNDNNNEMQDDVGYNDSRPSSVKNGGDRDGAHDDQSRVSLPDDASSNMLDSAVLYEDYSNMLHDNNDGFEPILNPGIAIKQNENIEEIVPNEIYPLQIKVSTTSKNMKNDHQNHGAFTDSHALKSPKRHREFRFSGQKGNPWVGRKNYKAASHKLPLNTSFKYYNKTSIPIMFQNENEY